MTIICKSFASLVSTQELALNGQFQGPAAIGALAHAVKSMLAIEGLQISSVVVHLVPDDPAKCLSPGHE